MDNWGRWTMLVIVGILVFGVISATDAFAQKPEKTLESECPKKENTNDFDALFCEAIFNLQTLVADVQTQLNTLSQGLQVNNDGTAEITSPDGDITIEPGGDGILQIFGDTIISSILSVGPTTIDSETGDVNVGGDLDVTGQITSPTISDLENEITTIELTPGPPGLACWDLNENGVKDPTTIDEVIAGSFLDKFGSFGGPNRVLNVPTGVAVDSSDKILVADKFNHRITIIDSDGNVFERFGSFGGGNGEFNQPDDVAIDSLGRIIVADLANHRIQILGSEGNFIAKFGSLGGGDGQFNQPQGVAVDSSDRIIVADRFNHRIQIFDSDGNFIKKFGTFGGGDGQFNQPFEVVTDNTDRIIVVDRVNHRIQIFDSDGNFLTKFGSFGSGDGQFFNPAGVGVDASDRIYVTETSTHRVQIFTAFDGTNPPTFLTKFGSFGGATGQFSSPDGIAFDSVGRIVVSEAANHRLQLFTEFDGTNTPTFLAVFGLVGGGKGLFNSPDGLEVDSLDRIIVADRKNHRIQIFDSNGNFLEQFGSLGGSNSQFNQPSDVAIDSSDRILIADNFNHRIQIFDSDGNFIKKFGSFGGGDGQFNLPHGIAVDSLDRIIVADFHNHRIQIFDSDGNFIKKFGSFGGGDGQFNRPSGVDVDSSDRILIADNSNHRIQIFDSDGNFIKKFGSFGSANNQFRNPEDVAIDNLDRIIISDQFNHEIKLFDSDGNFLSTFGSFGGANSEFNRPLGLDVDSVGRLLTTEFANHRVQIFAPLPPPGFVEVLIPFEDQNLDGEVDVKDCQGTHCWDLNGNGVRDLETEDANNDGEVDALDCRGERGARGRSGDDSDSTGQIIGTVVSVVASIFGSEVPSNEVGNVGDVYVNEETLDYYVKESDGWVLKSNLQDETLLEQIASLKYEVSQLKEKITELDGNSVQAPPSPIMDYTVEGSNFVITWTQEPHPVSGQLPTSFDVWWGQDDPIDLSNPETILVEDGINLPGGTSGSLTHTTQHNHLHCFTISANWENYPPQYSNTKCETPQSEG